MQNKSVFTKILAYAGTALAWLPLLAPVLFSALRWAESQVFRFDFLMPAELFPSATAGAILLLAAARWAGLPLKLILWAYLGGTGALVAGQVLAMTSGLASGESEPAGLAWTLVLISIALYTLAVMVVGVGGILLLRDLQKK